VSQIEIINQIVHNDNDVGVGGRKASGMAADGTVILRFSNGSVVDFFLFRREILGRSRSQGR
jgi:hypothetical protein